MNDTGSLAAPPSQSTVNGRWLWSLRVTALLATAVLTVVVTRLFAVRGQGPWMGQGLVVLAPLYLFALWSLRRNPPGAGGMATGMIIGLFTGAPFTLFGLLALPQYDPQASSTQVIPWLAPAGLLHLAWAALAIRVNFLPGSSRGGFRAFVWPLIAGLSFYIVSLTFWTKAVTVERMPTNEISAAGSMRSINTAQVQYSSMYGLGFAPTLQALGPPPEGVEPSPEAADLIDWVLTRGEKSGYVFTYTPAPPGEDGAISAYTLHARPREFGRTGDINFFSDQSGIVHLTREDRPANAKDPPVN